MVVRIVQLGSPRAEGEGLRIGTVRRPPRGVPKEEFASRDFYDIWLPMLAPSQELVTQAKAAESNADWVRFKRAYAKEMSAPDQSRLIDLLAALSHTTSFSVGCYCENEDRCHRSLLRGFLKERGAQVG